jgi:uncharacterized protein (UPF0261 family)
VKKVYVVATADTKGEEMEFLAGRISAAGVNVLRVDVGTGAAAVAVDIGSAEVADCLPDGGRAGISSGDRGAAVAAMTEAFRLFMASRSDVGAVIGIGGGGGTAIITAGMRELPYGVPKLMVSTLASGDVAPFVGISDIVMVPAVTDMAGLNRLSRTILGQAASAIAAMARTEPEPADGRPSVGLTMFGVTTQCVTAICDLLRDNLDCMVFHATGTGGRTMEKLADSGLLAGMIDITTTEVADLLCGGVLAATEDRFGALQRTKLPGVVSLGALDMVNFWAPETIPEKYGGRKFYRHNPNVTLMRTTAGECGRIGEWIGERLNACGGPLRVLIPEKGVSGLDIEGGPFYDPQADTALFEAIERKVAQTEARRIVRLPLHINDPRFAAAAASAYLEIA